jgi:hypothetical protein
MEDTTEDIIDMFEHLDQLPQEVLDVLEKHSNTWEDKDGYQACRDLVAELETIGYTCEYYLDAEPFNLRKIK